MLLFNCIVISCYDVCLSLSRGEKNGIVGQTFSDRQAKVEMSTDLLSKLTLTVSPVDTMVRQIVEVMNIIGSLFAIILYVRGCDCMSLVPLKPTVANQLNFYTTSLPIN